jgi:hypothetical protein
MPNIHRKIIMTDFLSIANSSLVKITEGPMKKTFEESEKISKNYLMPYGWTPWLRYARSCLLFLSGLPFF